MDLNRLKKRLKTSLFGKNIFYFEETESTNVRAMELAKEGAPEGTVVITDFQTSGKGRLNRDWLSPKSKNMLVSLLLRPELEVESVQKITLTTAAVLIESIKGFLKNRKIEFPQMEVKWPNDILVNKKKLAGILAESRLQEKNIEALVLGIGLNLNMDEPDLPRELMGKATSVFIESKHHIQIEDLLAFFLKRFEAGYEKAERTNYRAAVKQWKKYAGKFNYPILVHTLEGNEKGIFKDVNENGFLTFENESGILKTLIAGEIERIG
jgi:BirA family biotin operon repressor/biotin-[acetyl-CoA-carboxylase] ligase